MGIGVKEIYAGFKTVYWKKMNALEIKLSGEENIYRRRFDAGKKS